MNVTELARRLKITTSELKDLLPRLGFDIGRKAIKVDKKVAQKIIDKFESDPDLIQELRYGKQDLDKDSLDETTDQGSDEPIIIPQTITVRDFAELLDKPVAAIIQELMKNGILANLNERIDYETASIIAEDFGYQVKSAADEKQVSEEENRIEDLLSQESGVRLSGRPPVAVVMGHVDHGKTKLLDSIRQTDIVAKESGGITQHIGAYQVEKNGKKITFIDTPGHEAFTAMRSRGARVADIAILVIAADDGIMPQTEEAIEIIRNAKIPFIVALNKIDKPEADPEKVKQELTKKDILPEEWGGKTIVVNISAKTGEGIDSLLDNLLILAEVERDKIKANPNRPAVGTVIESHIDKGEGPVATIIVQTGTLKKMDVVQVGQVVGRIRAIKDHLGRIVDTAGPSMPVRILGLKNIPSVGDVFQSLGSKESLTKTEKKIQRQQKIYRDQQKWQAVKSSKNKKDTKIKILNIVIKADVKGSEEAILQSLEMLSMPNVRIKIIKSGLGNINDKDLLQASSSQALVLGFNVDLTSLAQEISVEKEISVKKFRVIYDLIEYVKSEMEKLVEYEKERVEVGKVKVLAIFRAERTNIILGGLVTKGKIVSHSQVEIFRGEEKISEGSVEMVKQAKQEVKEISAGSECGLQIALKKPASVKPGDIITAYKEELITSGK